MAQNFTPAMKTTASYLNDMTSGCSFYLVELIRFQTDSNDPMEAFEARVVLAPDPRTASRRAGSSRNMTSFLERVGDGPFREFAKRFFDQSQDLGMQVWPGKLSVAIHMPIPGTKSKISVAWLTPPGDVGWCRITDLTLGVQSGDKLKHGDTVTRALEQYLRRVEKLDGARPLGTQGMEAFTVAGDKVVAAADEIEAALAELANAIADQQ